MDKILLTTSGVRLPGRVRPPDVDHATMIYDYIERGYHVTAKTKESPLWQVNFARFPDKSFVNQPEGTNRVIRVLFTYWGDNAALTDKQSPEWMRKLDQLMQLAQPPNVHLSRNMNLVKETP